MFNLKLNSKIKTGFHEGQKAGLPKDAGADTSLKSALYVGEAPTFI